MNNIITQQDVILRREILPDCKAIIRSTYERYRWTGLPYDVALAAGELGVWRAVNGFNPSAGLPTVYISYHVRSEIQDAAMAHLGFRTSWRQPLKAITEAAAGLAAQHGSAPSPGEIAEQTNLPLAKVEYALGILHKMDMEEVSAEGQRRVRGEVEDVARRDQKAIDVDPFAQVAWLQAKAILHESLPIALKNPFWHVVMLTYTMEDEKHRPTQEEVASKHKISIKTVQRADKAIRAGLKSHLASLNIPPCNGSHQSHKAPGCWVCRLGEQTSLRGLPLEDMFSILYPPSSRI